MDNFQAIYKILRYLEAAMDLQEADLTQIGADIVGVSKERWKRYIMMLEDAGYIKGIRVYTDVTGATHIEDDGVRITLKGLEYLTENSIMQRLYKAARGIKEIVPMI